MNELIPLRILEQVEDEKVECYYVTFGVQYNRGEHAEQHPMGMLSEGYAVIEAPNYDVARGMAQAAFGREWAFLYMKEDFIDDGSAERYHPAGELLRIGWKRASHG